MLRRLNRTEFQNFLNTQSVRSFFNQTAAAAELAQQRAQRVELWGEADHEGRLLLAAKVFFRPRKRLFYRAELNYAPIGAAEHPEALPGFLMALENEFKRRWNVYALRVAPLVVKRRWQEGGASELTAEAEQVGAGLNDLGYRALAEDFFQDATVQARYLFVKDLPRDELPEVNELVTSKVRGSMRRCHQYGIVARELALEEYGLFDRMLQETAQRTGMRQDQISPASREAKSCYGSNLLYLLAEMRTDLALEALRAEQSEIDEAFERLDAGPQGRKQEQAKLQLEERLQAVLKRRIEVQDLHQRYGNRIPMAVAEFCFSSSDCIYLQSAADDRFQTYSAGYAIHEMMLAEACRRSCRYYNFFAVAGAESDDGVLAYKKKFKGEVEEYMGTFEKILRPRLARILEAK